MSSPFPESHGPHAFDNVDEFNAHLREMHDKARARFEDHEHALLRIWDKLTSDELKTLESEFKSWSVDKDGAALWMTVGQLRQRAAGKFCPGCGSDHDQEHRDLVDAEIKQRARLAEEQVADLSKPDPDAPTKQPTFKDDGNIPSLASIAGSRPAEKPEEYSGPGQYEPELSEQDLVDLERMNAETDPLLNDKAFTLGEKAPPEAGEWFDTPGGMTKDEYDSNMEKYRVEVSRNNPDGILQLQCKDCHSRIVSLEDRMLKAPDECDGCAYKAKWG